MPPRYNIAPGQDIPAVTHNRKPQVESFAPSGGAGALWAKKGASETRSSTREPRPWPRNRPSARPFRERRCLVPADGFYEWERQGRRKQPWHIRMREARPFAFAGLWDRWQPAEGAPIETVTIVTTVPNTLRGRIHDRMPVILPARHTVSGSIRPCGMSSACRPSSGRTPTTRCWHTPSARR